jgi:hypothetical protein
MEFITGINRGKTKTTSKRIASQKNGHYGPRRREVHEKFTRLFHFPHFPFSVSKTLQNPGLSQREKHFSTDDQKDGIENIFESEIGTSRQNLIP